MNSLSRKQRAFVLAYDGDAEAAALAAGYADSESAALRLMKHDRVLAAIERRAEGDRGGTVPIVLTPEQVEQVKTLSAYMTQEQIGDFFGFDERTFRRLKRRQPAVESAYKMGRATGIGRVAEGLYQMAANGDLGASIFFLKTQAGWRETTRHDIDHTSSDGSMATAPTEIRVVGVRPEDDDS